MFDELQQFVNNNNKSIYEIKKDLIFGYPPMVFNSPYEGLTEDEKNNPSRSLWKYVGKHIYGNNDKEMQLRLMLESHDKIEHL